MNSAVNYTYSPSIETDPGVYNQLELHMFDTSTIDADFTNSTLFLLSTEYPCNILNDTLGCNATMETVTNSTMTTGPAGFFAGPYWLKIVLWILAEITSVVTVFGNLLVVLSFVLERQIRQPTNYFIASLAVSDLLIGIFSMNLYTTYLLIGYWPLGTVICDLWLCLDYTVCLTSQYTVLGITIDRFCSVKIPAKYRNWRSEKKILVMVITTWVIPAVIFIPAIIGWPYFEGQRTVPNHECYTQFAANPLFNSILIVCYYWTTLIVMCGLYSGIYKVALDLQKKSEAKQKKMTSLVSMAGQTMSKIGMSMSKAQTPNANSKPKPKPETNTLKVTDRNRATSTTSFTSQKDGKDDERSSSPAFPSDTDHESQSPKQSHAPSSFEKHKKEKKNRNKDNAKKTNLDVPLLKVGKEEPVSNDAGYGTVNVHTSETQELGQIEGNSSNRSSSQLETTDSGKASSVADSACSMADKKAKPASLELISKQEPTANCNVNLNATPDRIKMHYMDQDSLQSLQSSDNIKLLSDILPKPNGQAHDCPPSPVWKKRESFKEPIVEMSENEADLGEHDNLTIKFAPEPKELNSVGSHNNQRSMAIVHVETIDDAGPQTISRIAQKDDIQPLHSKPKKKKRRKRDLGGAIVHSIAKTVGSRKRSRSKRDKQKSKSENRARKALRTITFILGAFVLCWTPYHVLSLIMGWCSTCVDQHFFNFTYWLCYLNSPLNPFCYAFVNIQFKRTFVRILKGDWHRT